MISFFKVVGRLNGYECVFLVDCGVISNFIFMKFAERYQLLTEVECGIVSFGDGRVVFCSSRLTKEVNV